MDTSEPTIMRKPTMGSEPSRLSKLMKPSELKASRKPKRASGLLVPRKLKQ